MVPQKLNVWAGIFIPDNLNSESYLELLERVIDRRFTQILEEEDNLLEGQLVFQQDGAPPYFCSCSSIFG